MWLAIHDVFSCFMSSRILASNIVYQSGCEKTPRSLLCDEERSRNIFYMKLLESSESIEFCAHDTGLYICMILDALSKYTVTQLQIIL